MGDIWRRKETGDLIIYGRLIVTSHSIWWTSYIHSHKSPGNQWEACILTSWPIRWVRVIFLQTLAPSNDKYARAASALRLVIKCHPQYLILIQFGIFLATSILISSSLKGYPTKMVQLISIEPQSISGLSRIRFHRSFFFGQKSFQYFKKDFFSLTRDWESDRKDVVNEDVW